MRWHISSSSENKKDNFIYSLSSICSMQTIINCKTFYKVIVWHVCIFDSCETEFKLKANGKHIIVIQVKYNMAFSNIQRYLGC